MAQLVNVIAPIFTNERDLFRQTIYFPLQLFATHVRGTSLDVHVDCATYDPGRFPLGTGELTAEMHDVPYLDVSAAVHDGELTLQVVNRHQTDALEAEIICQEGRFAGELAVYEVNGPDIKTENNFESEPVQTKRQPSVRADDGSLSYRFPPHSFTLLRGKIQQ
jgi:alpha-N-arabinofuranosidase